MEQTEPGAQSLDQQLSEEAAREADELRIEEEELETRDPDEQAKLIERLFKLVQSQEIRLEQIQNSSGNIVVPANAAEAYERSDQNILQSIAGKELVKIYINWDNDVNMNYPVDVAVNGKKITIPRGDYVDVHPMFVEALLRAEVAGRERHVMPDGTTRDIDVRRKRFSFNIHDVD